MRKNVRAKRNAMKAAGMYRFVCPDCDRIFWRKKPQGKCLCGKYFVPTREQFDEWRNKRTRWPMLSITKFREILKSVGTDDKTIENIISSLRVK